MELDKNGAVVAPASVPTAKRISRAKQQQGVIQQNGRKQQHQPRTHPQHHPPGKESEFDHDCEDDDEYEGDEYEEEEEDDELEGEEEDEDDDEDELQTQRRLPNGREVKPTSRQTGSRKNPSSRDEGGRDGLFNIENSLTVTGKQRRIYFYPC